MPGCSTSWNTFWTQGLCPGCLHRWTHTQCLACGEISPHREWYHWPGSRPARGKERRRSDVPVRG